MWRAAGKVSTVFGFRRRRVAAPTGGPHQAKAWWITPGGVSCTRSSCTKSGAKQTETHCCRNLGIWERTGQWAQKATPSCATCVGNTRPGRGTMSQPTWTSKISSRRRTAKPRSSHAPAAVQPWWTPWLAVEVLVELPGKQKVGSISAAYDNNPDNYDIQSKLRADRSPEPLALDLYVGLRVRLTRNLAKHLGYANGMTVVVESLDKRTGAVVVRAEMQQVLMCPRAAWPIHYVQGTQIRSTSKFWGEELAHVTFWPDRAGCAAAAYVALSGVRKDSDYLWRRCIKTEHFVPAK